MNKIILSGKFKISLLILTIALVFSSCYDNSQNVENTQAMLMTISQIKDTPGYAWFGSEFSSYHPTDTMIAKINKAFTDNNCSFYVFVNPSCACSGTQRTFPDAIKILDSCGIKENNYKIYSMLSYKSPHPYTGMMTLNELPGLFIVKGGKPVYSVFDSLNQYKILNPNSNPTIEEFIFKGIKSN